MNFKPVRLLDFYSNWVIIWAITWKIFKIGKSPWLPSILAAVVGISLTFMRWFQNKVPSWYLALLIISHLIPFALGMEENYDIEPLIISLFVYGLSLDSKIPIIYNDPYKYIFM